MLAILMHIKDPKETKRIAEGNDFSDEFKLLFTKDIPYPYPHTLESREQILQRNLKQVKQEVEEIMSQHKEKSNVMQKYAKDILNAQNMISFS